MQVKSKANSDRAEDKGVDCLNHVLDKFCHYSGHHVNRLKTQVFFSRDVSEEVASRLSAKLGFTKVNNLDRDHHPQKERCI